MIRAVVIPGTLMLMLLALTSCRYGELRSDLNSYQPPPWEDPRPARAEDSGAETADSPVDGTGESVKTGAVAVSSPLASVENDAVRAAEDQIKKARSLWTRRADEGRGFISPSPSRLHALERAGTDETLAASLLGRNFSLETLELLTLLRNPSVKAAQKDLLGSVQSLTQVINLDEILRQYAAFTEGIALPAGPMKGKEPPQTKFPFPGVTALKGKVAEDSVRMAAEKLSMARRKAVTAVRKAYWNLLFTSEARAITSETLDLFNHLESVADTRYRSGKANFQDVNKVIIRTQLLKEDLVTLGEKEQNLKVSLLTLLSLSPDTPVGAPEKKGPSRDLPDLSGLYARAMEHRQEIRLISAKQSRATGMLEMAETMILPPFTLNLSSYSDAAVVQAGSAAMKPTFPESPRLPPKPWFGTNDAWLAQTRQKISAIKANRVAAVTMTQREVRAAWFALDRAIREEALYSKSIVGLSRSTLDVSTKGYEAGKVSFADVIQSYTGWLKARTALARKRSDMGVARARLDAATGISSSALRPL